MKAFDEALRIIAENAPRLGPERVPLEDAGARFLAADLRARMSHPPFSQSAMDGWCVRAEDVRGAAEDNPISLRVVGESRAGSSRPEVLQAGTALRIFTGAPMAPGGDAVVVQEDASVEGDHVLLRFAATAGHHVRPLGASRQAGELLAAGGARVDAGVIAAAASEGLGALEVARRPRVFVLTTGDEVSSAGGALREGAIYDSNGPMMRELLREVGADVTLRHAGDDLGEVSAALAGAFGDHDVIVTTGGASVGAHDHVREAARRCGVRELFWKVAVKPGKPVSFGLRGEAETLPVVGLPGNPVSAFVTFHLFVRPLLRRMLGGGAALWLPVTLAEDYSHRMGRDEFIRCTLHQRGDSLWATPFAKQGSGALHDLALTDLLVRTSGDRSDFRRGEVLQALPIRFT